MIKASSAFNTSICQQGENLFQECRSDVDSRSIKWLKSPPLPGSVRVKHHTGRCCCVCFTEGFYASE